jgi:hypothetical protein
LQYNAANSLAAICNKSAVPAVPQTLNTSIHLCFVPCAPLPGFSASQQQQQQQYSRWGKPPTAAETAAVVGLSAALAFGLTQLLPSSEPAAAEGLSEQEHTVTAFVS